MFNQKLKNLLQVEYEHTRIGCKRINSYGFKLVADVVQVFPAKIKGRDRVEEFTSLVYTNCESSGYGLNIQVLDKPEDIRSDQPVLMLCMKVSRLRTDVESALKGLKRTYSYIN